MDAFKVHDQLIRDYRSFTEGFVEIRDRWIRDQVAEQSVRGAQWPAPWLALNPAFSPGGRIDELVRDGLLHPECERIFRLKRTVDDAGSSPITLHQHQRDAIELARTGASYVLTTGTGSGKSLAYIVPIVDRVLREGSGKGIKAIVVYPMNALANSQREELAKFLTYGYGEGAEPITFARYTGQEHDDTRKEVLRNPPDILLTNYVMLELVLTKPEERRSLIRAAEGLRFLVLDELHTYRGGDTQAQQRAEAGQVASQIFGSTVDAGHVITETLVRAAATREPSRESLRQAVHARGDAESDDRFSRRTLTLCGTIRWPRGPRTDSGSPKSPRPAFWFVATPPRWRRWQPN